MMQAIFLRRLIKRALTNNSTAPYPTIAGKNVFDSKIDPLLLEKYIASRSPFIVVYTDNIDIRFLDAKHNYSFIGDIEIKVMIECYNFGGQSDKLKSNATFLSMQNDILTHQVMLALLNSPNNHTERLKNYITTFSDIDIAKSTIQDIEKSDINNYNSVISFNVKINDNFTSEALDEDIVKIIDLFPTYKDLIDDATMLSEINQIAIDNVEEKLEGIDLIINERFNTKVDYDE